MPKHKGTEHLQGDLKRKISKLQGQASKKSAKGRSSGLDHISREGAGQVALVGPPNSGKSSIISTLTHAHSTVAEYPFSTYIPIQGMMEFEDIQVQLVDLPPISKELEESWLFNIIRLVDLVLLVVDMSVENILDSIANIEEIIDEKYSKRFPCFYCSLKNVNEQDSLRKFIYKGLRVIRVYTKTPGKKTDFEKPYVLPQGTTVFQAAMSIHKDLAENMKYARLWGSDSYDGQRIEREHELKDKDVIEVHTR